MTEDRHDYRCVVTLLLDDVTEDQARQFFADGVEVEGDVSLPIADRVWAMIENPGKVEVQP